jgi:hypothetical protein
MAAGTWDSRQWAYLVLRLLAAVGVVGSAFAPPGLPAAALCVGSGVVALLTCVGVNAGGPGERAGARAEAAALARIMPPQGDWPPYEER